LHIQQPHNKKRKFNCVLHAHSQFLCSLEHLKLSTPSQPHTFWSTAIRRDIRAVLYFCSCELRWRSVECVSFHCFNALPDIFAVMNCSVLGYRWQMSAWFNYFLPTGHFTKTWQLAGLFQQKMYCCNLSGGVALIVWFTTNEMCVKNKNMYAWSEQAITREIATW